MYVYTEIHIYLCGFQVRYGLIGRNVVCSSGLWGLARSDRSILPSWRLWWSCIALGGTVWASGLKVFKAWAWTFKGLFAQPKNLL